MNVKLNTRLIIACMLALVILMSFHAGFAQDESGDTSTETAGNDTTAQTADTTDVSTEPTAAPRLNRLALAKLPKSPTTSTSPRYPRQKMKIRLCWPWQASSLKVQQTA